MNENHKISSGSIIIFIMIIIACFISGCKDKSEMSKKITNDTIYVVQYSDSADFKIVTKAKEFYRKSRDKYYLPPDGIDLEFWTGKSMPPIKTTYIEYYARVIGISNDGIFFISKPKKLTYNVEFFHLHPEIKKFNENIQYVVFENDSIQTDNQNQGISH